MIKEAAPELNASSSEAEEEKEEHPKVDGEKDPDFSQVSPLPRCSCKWKDTHTSHTPSTDCTRTAVATVTVLKADEYSLSEESET